MPAKLPEDEGKRHAVTIRTTLELKQQIEAAAVSSSRSVAQEIEARVRDSFARAGELSLQRIIREEIRAALGEAEEAKRQRLPAGFSGTHSAANTMAAQAGCYGKALSSVQTSISQIHDRSALNGKQ